LDPTSASIREFADGGVFLFGEKTMAKSGHKGLRVKGFESMEKRHRAAKKGKRKASHKRVAHK
jgi:hypothetical protein